MSDTVDPKYADKRTAERYLRQGAIEEKAWEKHLKSLPDVSEKAAQVTSVLDSDDFDDDIDDDIDTEE
jgi:hypothetical protein